MRNSSKKKAMAVCYVIVGAVVFMFCIIAIAAMWFSGTFLPVYIAGKFVLKNRILRSVLYVVLIAIAIVAASAVVSADYYLTKQRRHRKRR